MCDGSQLLGVEDGAGLQEHGHHVGGEHGAGGHQGLGGQEGGRAVLEFLRFQVRSDLIFSSIILL